MSLKNKLIIFFMTVAFAVFSLVIFWQILSRRENVMNDTKITIEQQQDNLKSITLASPDTSEKLLFTNVFDQYQLLDKSRQEIESEYKYQKNFGHFYYLDSCTMISYQKDIVTQVSTGREGTYNCFDPNFRFDKEKRLELFGQEDREVRFAGLPGFGMYYYTTKGVVLIKANTNLFQIWMTNEQVEPKMYDQIYSSSEDARFRLNSFGYNPVYDDEGRVLPSTEEE